jgi:lipoprotein-anchoring transpeptidase ErfK/SrfK
MKRMIETINRRDFLKYTGLFTASVLLSGSRRLSSFSLSQHFDQNTAKLGRVLFDGVQAHVLPDNESEIIKSYAFNDLVDYKQEMTVPSSHSHNEIWCQLTDGSYIHSKYLQPVENRLNDPVMDIPAGGQLAEITVPFSTAVVNNWNNNRNETENQMFFFGSTHWIYGLGKDEADILYYLVKEDRWEDSYYVNAAHMRFIPNSELEPTSTDMDQTQKFIRINLAEQFLVAYEYEQPVFMSALSSGQLAGDVDLTTPEGNFIINYKRPSRHMVHSDRIGINDKELYGVPWVSYFTESGIAFHGTYWHNDFSQPKSHGCINLPIPAAKWIYRWTQPVVPPMEKKYVSNTGTRVEVI